MQEFGEISTLSKIFCVIKIKQEKVDKVKKKVDEEEMEKRKEELLKAGIKNCPNCKAYCEKVSGCNRMTCDNTNCKINFCWFCLHSSPNATDIYKHLALKHNGKIW
jgi:hypothetical protein